MPPIRYVELHAHSAYSLGDGVDSPQALVARAAHLGMPALALTDHNAVYGAVPFVQACQQHGIQPILGAELALARDYHLTLLVADATGWGNLCTLISIAQHRAPKGRAVLPWDALHAHQDGLVCLSGCRQGPIAAALLRWDRTGAFRAARWLRDTFGPERCAIELQHHLRPDDARLVRDLHALAGHLQLRSVVSNNVHYIRREHAPLHDVLTAIRQHTTLDAAGTQLRMNSEYYLKGRGQLLPLFPGMTAALDASTQIAALCDFQLRYGLQDLPLFSTPPDCSTEQYLAHLCREALPQRYADAQRTRVAQHVAHELGIITRAGLANYMLIVWDIVRWARQQGIRCQGRGSAANSLVAFLLGISPIDPLAHDLTFERFLSDERPAMPDIDLDIAADRREDVIQYVYGRYGVAHAALACTFSTFGARQALRDVAAVLDMPHATAVAALTDPDRDGGLVAGLHAQLQGLPRHVGQHSGGMILSRQPLCERVSTEPTAMPGRTVVQWDKDALEEAGIIKIDLLGLRMLSALSEAEALLHQQDHVVVLNDLTFDDPDVYQMISAADTLGCFQIESRAQASVLPVLQPRDFADLVVAISLIRPGPLQGNMVHPYLRRRAGTEPVTYAHPRLEPVLHDTLGVILFHEQVLQVAHALAGWTLGCGEQLRRAMGKAGPDTVAALRATFVADAQARGVPHATVDIVFRQLEAFGSYSFPKSHAAAFAVLVYQSAWLKRYHPAVFLCGLLNHQPMGFWPPSVLVRDARRHGVTVQPLDVNASAARCMLDGDAVRIGLNYLHDLGTGADRMVAARQAQPFHDLRDLCMRTQMPRHLIESLIRAGACDGWGQNRQRLVWQLGTLRYTEAELDLGVAVDMGDLPVLDAGAADALQAHLLNISVTEHPLARWRAQLTAQGYVSSADLASCAAGQRVRMAGTIISHQAPSTAKGMQFLTLEDEAGLVNVVVRPWLVAQIPRATRGVLHVTGVVQQQGGATTLLAVQIVIAAI